MNPDAVVRLLREGLLLVLILSAGPLGTAMIIGLVISILQATTQVQEQTLSFVPKLIGISLVLAIAGPWMMNEIVRFTRLMFDAIALIQ
jgi:flagellar biosynthetic protein FliQ